MIKGTAPAFATADTLRHDGPAAAETPPSSLGAWTTFASLFAAGVVLLMILDALLHGSVAFVPAVSTWLCGAAVLWFAAFTLRLRFPATASFVRFFLPLILYGAFYPTVHAMITAARPGTVDAALAAIDRRLFGVDPVVWLDAHGSSGLTDALSLCYISYYAGMPVLLVRMWRKNAASDFRMALSAVALGWYGALATYAMFPALGPQRFLAGSLPSLSGALPVTDWIRGFLSGSQGAAVRDCVPSMHTCVTLLTLAFAFRHWRAFFLAYLVPALGLILATVYLQQHYAIDVLLGVLAFVCIDTLARKLSLR